jgi:tripartite-type tricarboxylate transporter receptor subunit TctC
MHVRNKRYLVPALAACAVVWTGAAGAQAWPAKPIRMIVPFAAGGYGMFFPAATSREIITRYHAEMMKVLKDPDVRSLMAKDGSEPLGSTPEEFAGYFKREVDKYAKVIQAAGAQAE